MSSWLALLLVTAACLRFGGAEGDPLPAALVELVRNSPISSIEDLQLLLLSDSVDEDQDTSAASGGHRLPRSLDAQPAQQALCKVRTEVVEVTRSMLDQSNAHFLLWPPCVEVQRCSGCCNTKSLQCVPVVTHTRYLQVMKIEYMNKKPTYAKAVVSVLDHVECRCQPATRPPPPKKKSPRRPHGNQAHGNQAHGNQAHGNQTLSTAQGQVKVHSKDELHQWDELKQNQRSHMEHDLTDQHWSLRGDTFTRAADSSSLPREHPSRAEEAFHLTPLWSRNSTSDKTGHSAGNITTEVRDNVRDIPSFGLDESTQTHSPTWHQDKYTQIQTSASSSSPASVTPNPDTHTEANGDERRPRPTKEPNPDPQVRHGDNETPQKDRLFEREEAKLEEERKELLLLHKRLDQEKEILRQQQLKREEEERLREAEGHLHKHHRHHVQTTTHTTATTATTTTATTQPPAAPAGPRPPAQPRQRRRRKNRKRISKAAMRAMLM